MKKVSFRVHFFLVMAIVLVMFFLYNNSWSRKLEAVLSLFINFMPFAFSYYILYSVLVIAVIYITILLIWPDPPEDILSPVKVEKDKIR